MTKKGGASSGEIRFVVHRKRTTDFPRTKSSLSDTLPETCFVAMCDHIAFAYPFDLSDGLFGKDHDKSTFDLLVQRECGNSDTLFTGELRNAVLNFQRTADDRSIQLLRTLLRRTFGHSSLSDHARDMVALNPTIRLGSVEIATLHLVLGYFQKN